LAGGARPGLGGYSGTWPPCLRAGSAIIPLAQKVESWGRLVSRPIHINVGRGSSIERPYSPPSYSQGNAGGEGTDYIAVAGFPSAPPRRTNQIVLTITPAASAMRTMVFVGSRMISLPR